MSEINHYVVENVWKAVKQSKQLPIQSRKPAKDKCNVSDHLVNLIKLFKTYKDI